MQGSRHKGKPPSFSPNQFSSQGSGNMELNNNQPFSLTSRPGAKSSSCIQGSQCGANRAQSLRIILSQERCVKSQTSRYSWVMYFLFYHFFFQQDFRTKFSTVTLCRQNTLTIGGKKRSQVCRQFVPGAKVTAFKKFTISANPHVVHLSESLHSGVIAYLRIHIEVNDTLDKWNLEFYVQ